MEKEGLAGRLREGDERALEEIVEGYKAFVYGVLRRMLGEPYTVYDIEPLVFDVFYYLWCYRTRIMDGCIGGFLNTAAHNRARSYQRRREREIPTDPEDMPETTSAEGITEEIVESRERIKEGLGKLDRQTRELFVRRYYLGETVREAAKALRMKESAAKSRMMRGRERLKEIQKQNEGKPMGTVE